MNDFGAMSNGRLSGNIGDFANMMQNGGFNPSFGATMDLARQFAAPGTGAGNVGLGNGSETDLPNASLLSNYQSLYGNRMATRKNPLTGGPTGVPSAAPPAATPGGGSTGAPPVWQPPVAQPPVFDMQSAFPNVFAFGQTPLGQSILQQLLARLRFQ